MSDFMVLKNKWYSSMYCINYINCTVLAPGAFIRDNTVVVLLLSTCINLGVYVVRNGSDGESQEREGSSVCHSRLCCRSHVSCHTREYTRAIPVSIPVLYP